MSMKTAQCSLSLLKLIWRLEQHEIEFYGDEWLGIEDQSACDGHEMARILKKRTFPFSAKEPGLTLAELTRLDALADRLELHRLENCRYFKILSQYQQI